MSDDPAGHYAALDVHPRAEQAAIAAAFRSKARVLHPDIPGSGNADAFMRIRAAYDVVGDAESRAAYDRAARAAAMLPAGAPDVSDPVSRWPRLSDLPLAVWVVLGGVVCLATVMALVEFNRSPSIIAGPVIRPTAPSVVSPGARPAPANVPITGPSNDYVSPGNDAVLWRHDAARDAYVPAGHVAAFSSVQALGQVPKHGLVEIRLADGSSGFIDAARLTAGSRDKARRAYCAYEAGTAPRNGEILERRATGPMRIALSNRGLQEVVLKLRDASGHVVAAVFLAPGNSTVLGDLPDTSYRLEYAVGELWSRACNSFAAGMRAQRFPYYATPAALSSLVIPPDFSVVPPPEDISDAEFEGD
jgi:curved DNA-binding protein CbpA